MRRLDVAMAVAGVLVVAVGVGGSFLFGSTESLAEAGAPELAALDVSIASVRETLPAPAAPTGGATKAEIPVDVSVTGLQSLTFLVEVDRPQALAGNAELTFHVLDPQGNRHDPDATLSSGPGTGASLGEMRTTVDLVNLTDEAILGVWTVVVEGTTSGPASGDFPLTVSVDGVALRAAEAP